MGWLLISFNSTNTLSMQVKFSGSLKGTIYRGNIYQRSKQLGGGGQVLIILKEPTIGCCYNKYNKVFVFYM